MIIKEYWRITWIKSKKFELKNIFEHIFKQKKCIRRSRHLFTFTILNSTITEFSFWNSGQGNSLVKDISLRGKSKFSKKKKVDENQVGKYSNKAEVMVNN